MTRSTSSRRPGDLARPSARTLVAALPALGALVSATACGALVDAAGPATLAATPPGTSAAPSAAETAPVAITAGDTSCQVARTALGNGVTTFSITNTGSQITEVYVYDGPRIVTEKENIGPGTSYDLTADLPAGSYQVACKPGMVGTGMRQAITVTGTSSSLSAPGQAAVAAYRRYVQQQTRAAIPLVVALRDAVARGDRTQAQAAYVASRVPWERIEPVAESFGDLDPRMDAREVDLAPGDTWSGWHRLEKALWTGEDVAAQTPVADQLVADVTEVFQRVPNAALTPTSIGNGATELLDEVSKRKVTGEEEVFSHTDLIDLAANVDGAQQALTALRPLVASTQPDLVHRLDARFTAVDAALAAHRTGTGPTDYATYTTVDAAGRTALSRVVDGLAEPLSRLGAAAASAGRGA